MKYKTLYVFTDKNHPKRGNRYLHHFEKTGTFRDIVKVIWKTDGKRGYVREGEYEDVESYNARVRPAQQRVADAKQRAMAQYRADCQELGEIMNSIKWSVHLSLDDYRRKKAKADAFKLEYC